MSPNYCARPSGRNLQSVKCFGPLLDGARFELSRSLADTNLGDHGEQGGAILGRVREEPPPTPGDPHLNRMSEAQLPRRYPSKRGRLRHQQADQILGEQVCPQLLLKHLWGFSAQLLHAQRRMDVEQIELDMPAHLEEPAALRLSGFSRAQERGDQRLLTDFHLPQRQYPRRKALVLLLSHLLGAQRRARPYRQMIARARLLPTAKAALTCPMPLEDEVHPASKQIGDQEVARVVAVGQHHIASKETILQGSEQTVLARSLAFVRSHRHIEHRPMIERDDSNQPCNGKAGSGRLLTVLRKEGRDWTACPLSMSSCHRSTSPTDLSSATGRGVRIRANTAREFPHQLLREALACHALAASGCTLGLRSAQQALDHRLFTEHVQQWRGSLRPER